jgi:mannan endo-1,4-beta-mannosidase
MVGRGRLGMTVACLAITSALAAFDPDRAEGANTGFVRTQGTQFTLNGGPFYFTGTNAYYLMISAAWGATNYTDDTMTMANQLGFTVLRTWAFNDGATDGLALQPSPGVYNETNFRALDYVLDQADRHGVRLILALVNGPPDFGGVAQYVKWCAPGQTVLAFYNNASCRTLYQNYVRHVVTRVNTYNGRRYADDPTIFAWELGNELELPDNLDKSGQAIRGWIGTMAAFIKSLDRNHMVATGESGFDVTASGYSPVSTAYSNQAWLFNGIKGVAFTQNTADPNIAFASAHLYPEWWNLSAAAGSTWIADHARIARNLGKPFVLGEYGASSNTATTLTGWLGTVNTEQVGGSLMWQLMCPACYGMRDQFGVAYPPASAVSNVLAQAAATANAKSSAPSPPPPAGGFTVGATTAVPSPLSPGQTLTVTTTVTAAAATSGAIVELEIYGPNGTLVAQQAYSGQSFTAGQARRYTWSWPSPSNLAGGAYTTGVGVYDATGNPYAVTANATSFTVQVSGSPALAAFQVGSTTASPSVARRRQTVTVSTEVTAGAAASGILIDVGIYDSAGQRVLQKVFSGQSFAAGQTRSFSFGWSSTARGTYTVSVGVFTDGWSTLYTWEDLTATFEVR